VLPCNQNVKDPAKEKMVPFILKGLPEEIENGLPEVISKPMKRAINLLANMEAYEKSVADVEAASKIAAAQKTEMTNKKKDFDKYLVLARTNIEAQKYKDAEQCLSKALEILPDQTSKSEVDKIQKEIERKLGNTIFGEVMDLSDGSSVECTTDFTDEERK